MPAAGVSLLSWVPYGSMSSALPYDKFIVCAVVPSEDLVIVSGCLFSLLSLTV